MAKFTYEPNKQVTRYKSAVRKDGKLIGYIRGGPFATGGFRFWPKGATEGGTEFRSVERVRQEIEQSA